MVIRPLHFVERYLKGRAVGDRSVAARKTLESLTRANHAPQGEEQVSIHAVE
jgi:hypothetical protein